MNAAEFRYLKARLGMLRTQRRLISKRTLACNAVLFGSLAGVTLLAERDVDPRLIVCFWVIAGVCIGSWSFLEERKRIAKREKGLEVVISQGVVHEFRFLSSRVAEFEEIEDEGACYAFELTAGGVVLIAGQDFYESAKFPNNDFSIVEFRGPGAKTVDFQIKKRGEKLTPFKCVSSRDKKRLALPEHLTFVAGTLDSFFESLQVA